MVERRVPGTPLEYILGWAEFCGLRIAVDPGVFVPRQRTAFLVGEAVAARAARAARAADRVVDLCCGSGAIGVAVLTALAGRSCTRPTSTRRPCGARAATSSTVGGQVYQGDLYRPLPADLRGRVDLLLVNAPYVPTEAIELMPPEARDYEARVALDGGGDGLDVHRRVAADAGVAGARRASADRNQRPTGTGGRRHLRRQRAGRPGGRLRRTRRHRRGRNPSPGPVSGAVRGSRVLGSRAVASRPARAGAFGADARDDDEDDRRPRAPAPGT